MTSEYLITFLLLLFSLATLDYLLLFLRRQPTVWSFVCALPAVLQRARESLSSLIPLPSPEGQGENSAASASSVSPSASPSVSVSASPLIPLPSPEGQGENSAASASSVSASVSPSASSVSARVRIEAEVPPESVLHITIRADRQGRAFVQQKVQQRWNPRWPRLERFSPRRLLDLPAERLAGWLFALALLTYLLTRLIGLTEFPIYFFGDEAIQTTTAADLVRDGFRGPRGIFLPTYFQNGLYFNLSASVYLQVVPYLLFGKSIFVTRATSVLVTLLAAISVGLILRDFLGAKRWWLGTLLLSVVPAWFLHSRTAFETVLFVSFYAAFLYFYLGYRLRDPAQVYWAVLFAGLAFYSYSPGQLVLAVTGALLFFSDLSYHWQQRATLLKALGLVALFALPYLRFRLTVEYSPLDHLRSLGSYWVQPTPLADKLTRFAAEYLRGLSPGYWFFDSPDMARHQMRDYGHIPLWFAPFLLIGIVLALWRWRSPAARLLLLAGLAAPSGAALAEIGITRALVFVIPASLLTALGLDFLLQQAESLWRSAEAEAETGRTSAPVIGNALSLTAFIPLVLVNAAMLADALRNGPIWYTDYGLYGMQYGAKQIFQQTVVPVLRADPQARFYVTPSWANGAEHFVSFFVPPEMQSRVSLGQVYDFINPEQPFTEHDYFIATWQEFERIRTDTKFAQVTVRSTIPYPNGETGFYIFTARLAENIRQLLAEEDLARRTPVEETIEWMGQTVRVRHSRLSGGRLQDVLDGDPETLARGERANPILYEFFFSQPLSASELVLTTGSMRDFDVQVLLYPPGETRAYEYTHKFTDLPDDPTITLRFENGPAQFNHVILFIRDNTQGEVAQVHVREIQFR